MKRAGRIALTAAFLIAPAVAGGFYLLSRGYSARAEPSALEAALARRLRHLATPAGARDLANPVPPTPEALASARAHFADHCAICHANDGSGDTPIGQGLYPKAPDMRERETQGLTDGELFYVIRNGVRFTGMPGWGSGPEHEDHDSWGLVHFIRRLPRLTPEELEEMKRLNPVSAHDLEREREAEEFLSGGDDGTGHGGRGDHEH